MNFISEIIDSLLKNAEKLGQLSVTAVWGFFTLILLAYIAWKIKIEKDASEKAWDARIKEAEADGLMSNALEKLADQIKEMRHSLKCIGGQDD